MSVRGLGDRWLAGEAVDGVALAHGDAVRVTRGAAEGRTGRVALLMRGPPDPLYLVQLDGEPRPLRARQSELARVE